MPKIIDQALALQLAGGSRELAEELLKLLLRDLPGLREGLDNALAAHRLSELHALAHKLNGATRYCGVPALALAADALERQALEGELVAVADDVQRVIAEIERLLRAVEQH